MHQQRCMYRIAQKNTDTRNLQQHKQGIHRHHSPPRYHNAASHASPYGPPRPNMTSSVKPEVHNVSQRCQKTTKPWPQGICTTNFVKIGPVVPEICSRTDRQTHTNKQTDRNMPLPCDTKSLNNTYRCTNLHNKFCEDWSSGSRDMLADRQTHTDR